MTFTLNLVAMEMDENLEMSRLNLNMEIWYSALKGTTTSFHGCFYTKTLLVPAYNKLYLGNQIERKGVCIFKNSICVNLWSNALYVCGMQYFVKEKDLECFHAYLILIVFQKLGTV